MSWEQQPNESAKAYSLFLSYLRLRNYAQVAAEAQAQGIATTPEAVKKLAQRHQWKERASAYDAHCMQQQMNTHAHMQERLRSLASALVDKGITALSLYPPELMKPREALECIKVGVALHNASPEPTESPDFSDYWNNPLVWRLIEVLEGVEAAEGLHTEASRVVEAAIRLVLDGKYPPALNGKAGGDD